MNTYFTQNNSWKYEFAELSDSLNQDQIGIHDNTAREHMLRETCH